jgi:hypothetical protein
LEVSTCASSEDTPTPAPPDLKTLKRTAQNVIADMARDDVPAFQVTFRLTRALKRIGAQPDLAMLRPAIVAAIRHRDFDGLSGEPLNDPDLLVADVIDFWDKVRSIGDALEQAVHRARDHVLIFPPPPVPRLVALIVTIAADLQRFQKLHGFESIILPQEKIATLLGCTQAAISKAIKLAISRGWLTKEHMEKPPAAGRRAQRYRCRAPNTETNPGRREQ